MNLLSLDYAMIAIIVLVVFSGGYLIVKEILNDSKSQ